MEPLSDGQETPTSVRPGSIAPPTRHLISGKPRGDPESKDAMFDRKGKEMFYSFQKKCAWGPTSKDIRKSKRQFESACSIIASNPIQFDSSHDGTTSLSSVTGHSQSGVLSGESDPQSMENAPCQRPLLLFTDYERLQDRKIEDAKLQNRIQSVSDLDTWSPLLKRQSGFYDHEYIDKPRRLQNFLPKGAVTKKRDGSTLRWKGYGGPVAVDQSCTGSFLGKIANVECCNNPQLMQKMERALIAEAQCPYRAPSAKFSPRKNFPPGKDRYRPARVADAGAQACMHGSIFVTNPCYKGLLQYEGTNCFRNGTAFDPFTSQWLIESNENQCFATPDCVRAPSAEPDKPTAESIDMCNEMQQGCIDPAVTSFLPRGVQFRPVKYPIPYNPETSIVPPSSCPPFGSLTTVCCWCRRARIMFYALVALLVLFLAWRWYINCRIQMRDDYRASCLWAEHNWGPAVTAERYFPYGKNSFDYPQYIE